MNIEKAEALIESTIETTPAAGTMLEILAGLGLKRNRAKNLAKAATTVEMALGQQLRSHEIAALKAEVLKKGKKGKECYLVLWLPDAYRAVTIWH